MVRLPSAFGGFGADHLLAPGRVDRALDRLGVDTVRINVPWAQVAGEEPGDRPDLGLYDLAVDRVLASGRRVQLTLSGPAPPWATGNRRLGAWRPDARRYAAFAGAVARHFRGRVARYSIWNEPNWWNLLRPRLEAGRLYRRMYRRGRAAVKAADPRAAVLFGELAPLGQPKAATAPLRFLRRITCSDRAWRATRRCPPLVADGVALHPYTLHWAPEFPGRGRDDVTMGSLRRLNRALDRARPPRRARHPGRPRAAPVPDRVGLPRALQAGARAAALVATSAAGWRWPRGRGACKQVVWYQLAAPPPRLGVHWDSALLDFRGRPRPVFRAVRAWSASPAERCGPLGLAGDGAGDAGVGRVARLQRHVGADVVDGLGDRDGRLAEPGGDQLELAVERGHVAARPHAVEVRAHQRVDHDRALGELEPPLLQRPEVVEKPSCSSTSSHSTRSTAPVSLWCSSSRSMCPSPSTPPIT